MLMTIPKFLINLFFIVNVIQFIVIPMDFLLSEINEYLI